MLSSAFSMEADKLDLLGLWVTDPEDHASLSEYGRVALDFRPDGQLIYTIFAEGSRQVVRLVYQITDDVLITDQLSSPREERTRFEIRGDTLTLFYAERPSTYRRSAEIS
jgi:hypothetical protein